MDLEAAVRSGRELGVVPRDLEVGDDQFVLQGAADAHLAAERELVERRRAAVSVDRRGPRDTAGTRTGALLLRDLRLLGLLVMSLLLGLLPALLLGHLRLRLVLRRLLLGCLGGPAGSALLLRVVLRCLVLRRLMSRCLLSCLLRCGHGGGARCAAGHIQPRTVGRVAEVHGRAGADFHLVDPLALHKGAIGAAVVLNDPTAAAPADRGVTPGHPGVVKREISLRITSEGVRPGRIERPGPSIQFQYEFRHSSPTELSPELAPIMGSLGMSNIGRNYFRRRPLTESRAL
ncbi:hypothetical protein GCM10010449_06800 [Streptomyces rectiviolaceus]|uniref:Uncharacterized protein n=1 Tax=Streptomyces rectiviolaceus TaxID=332591 RepID=A0ABP6M7J3_9ACTN